MVAEMRTCQPERSFSWADSSFVRLLKSLSGLTKSVLACEDDARARAKQIPLARQLSNKGNEVRHGCSACDAQPKTLQLDASLTAIRIERTIRTERRWTITRAGREPAEDVRRAMKRACQEAGLVVSKTMARLIDDRTARAVMVDGSPPGWPHDGPMVSLLTLVTIAGDVGRVRIYCQGTDDDPILSVFTNPMIQDCVVTLEEIGETLKTALIDRVRVRKLVAEGREPPFVVGDWTWDAASFK